MRGAPLGWSGKSASLSRALVNLLGFQAAWFACVGGAGRGWPTLGPFVVALWLALHVARLDGRGGRGAGGRAAERSRELKLLASAVMLGCALDGTLALGGVIAFPAHAGPAVPTTPWMAALWAAFAATLRHSLDWARRRYALGAVAGALIGPLAYAAGEALGAITVAPPPFGWLMVAAEWALAIPLLLWLRERLEGPPPAPAPPSGAPARGRGIRVAAGDGR